MHTATYRNIDFDIPDIAIGAEPIVFERSDYIEQNEAYDLSRFDKINLPIDFGSMYANGLERFERHSRKSSEFPENDIRVLDMPIKFPGTNYRLPSILKPFAQFIQKIVEEEDDFYYGRDEVRGHGNTQHFYNPERRYCYLTIDQKLIREGDFPRNPGCHVDGFQGDRIQPKVRSDYSYVWANACSATAFKQAFPCSHLDPAKDNFFHYFDSIAKDECAYQLKCHTLYLFNAYTVHRVTQYKSANPVYRTFIRMTYSVREFDRLGNTHNPMFNYNWEMVPRKLELK